MNIQSPVLSPVRNPSPARDTASSGETYTTTDTAQKQATSQRISGVEFVPADINDAAFQAQQLADQRQQQQQLSRESQQFMTLQQLDGDSRKGRFIDIQV